tara:strand:+ start:6743 stop:6946 length:204 start_codon:yes stop_codon:yes gene_type:complete
MNTIEQKELNVAMYLIKQAKEYVKNYSMAQDYTAATLALLWCAFETEAMAQGLTTWRGIELGDDHEN